MKTFLLFFNCFYSLAPDVELREKYLNHKNKMQDIQDNRNPFETYLPTLKAD